jgi:hypothetical protein
MRAYIKVIFIGVILLCIFIFYKKIYVDRFTHIRSSHVVDIQHIAGQPPNNIQSRLAWGLWKLDNHIIKISLDAGANPYALASYIIGLPAIDPEKKLSPFAIPLESYLKSTYLEENHKIIKRTLDKLYDTLEFLITHNISIDEGVLTIGSHPSMRQFVKESLLRLKMEKKLFDSPDSEGEHALFIMQKIQDLITIYQPEKDLK